MLSKGVEHFILTESPSFYFHTFCFGKVTRAAFNPEKKVCLGAAATINKQAIMAK
jgi:hypothetical protein